MSKVSTLVSKEIGNYLTNRASWNIFYNAKAEGLAGDGTTDDYADLSTLINTTINGAEATIIFSPGTYKISTSITVPSNITLFLTKGAMLSPDSGKIITINGPVEAGLWRIFTGSGTIAGSMKVDAVFPQWWGAKGDGVTDDTSAILSAKAYAAANLPCKLHFPKGTYCYTSLGNLAYTGLTIEGESDRETVLKCTNTNADHNAIVMDAFSSGSPSDPFIQRCNLKNITVEGNSNTQHIINVQGIARSNWENVIARVGKSADGKAFMFQGVMLSTFKHLICSTDLDTMSSIPRYGLYVKNGVRAGSDIGSSTNNVFISCYMEGMPQGIVLSVADQNTFIGGSPESCTVYGLVVDSGSKFNTFIGTGFESDASTADIADNGKSTQFINIYSSKSVILQGRGAKVSGGHFDRIEVQSGATKNCIENVTINYFNSGSGGFVDNGTSTNWKNIYDHDLSDFIYPFKARVGITVGASPFTWTNSTGQHVEVFMQSGTVSQVLKKRTGDGNVLFSPTAPTSYLLSPGDQLEFTYSVSPALSYSVINGF